MKKLFLLSVLSLPLVAQSICTSQFSTVPAIGTSAVIDNRVKMCSLWVVTYNSTGFSALSIQLDTANDVSGSAGTFALSTGTVLEGANPSTAVNCQTTSNCQFIINGYAPWVRLNFTSKTGTGTLTALAFGTTAPSPVTTITPGGGGSPCPGTVGTPCVVDGPDATGAAPTKPPVQAAGLDGSGNILPFQFPTLVGATNVTTSGNTQIIAASGTTVIRLGMLEFTPITSGNSVNFKLVYGTGVNCATGATDLTAVQSNVLAYSHDFTFPLNVPAGKALCYNIDAATPTNVTYEYSRY